LLQKESKEKEKGGNDRGRGGGEDLRRFAAGGSPGALLNTERGETRIMKLCGKKKKKQKKLVRNQPGGKW